MAVLTNAQKLVEAETAYHSIMTGGQVRVVVDQNGERVEYSTANASALVRYIADLKRLIAIEAGLYPSSGPAQVIF